MGRVSIPEGLKRGNPLFYEFKGGSSNKFWGGFKDGHEWVCVWGRNGRPPQGSKRMPGWAFERKAAEKRREGYVRSSVDAETLFLKERAWFAKVRPSVSAEFMAALEAAELMDVSEEVALEALESGLASSSAPPARRRRI